LIEQKREGSGIDWYSMAKKARIRKFSEYSALRASKEKAKQGFTVQWNENVL